MFDYQRVCDFIRDCWPSHVSYGESFLEKLWNTPHRAAEEFLPEPSHAAWFDGRHIFKILGWAKRWDLTNTNSDFTTERLKILQAFDGVREWWLNSSMYIYIYICMCIYIYVHWSQIWNVNCELDHDRSITISYPLRSNIAYYGRHQTRSMSDFNGWT